MSLVGLSVNVQMLFLDSCLRLETVSELILFSPLCNLIVTFANSGSTDKTVICIMAYKKNSSQLR